MSHPDQEAHDHGSAQTGDSHPHPHEHAHSDEHGHSHQGSVHAHTHGVIDASITTSERGMWAIKWSFVGLFVTALLQVTVYYYSRSVGLLADTIHNFADACTAIPLAIAFGMSRLKPTKNFPFGFGRVEDLAGVAIVAIIFFSAVAAAYESIYRLLHPHPVSYLWAVVAASIVGFIGNESVAIFRIKVGKEIGSAALVADGYHARTDGWTSLAVLAGAVGVWFGYPKADPLVGIGITIAIGFVVWDSVRAVFTRLLDGIDPQVLEGIRETARRTEGIGDVQEVRARWIGHRIHAEVNVAVKSDLTVADGHKIAVKLNENLLRDFKFLSRAVVHVDPLDHSGEHYHEPRKE